MTVLKLSILSHCRALSGSEFNGCNSGCKCSLTQRMSRNRPATTEPDLKRADTK